MGNQKLIVMAVDKNGLSTTKTISVKVKEKEPENKPESPENSSTASVQDKEEYLSGELQVKIDNLEAYLKDNPEISQAYEKNLMSLKSSLPERLSVDKISTQLSSVWVTEDMIEDFIQEVFESKSYSFSVDKFELNGNWSIKGTDENRALINSVFGLDSEHTAYHLLDNLMNQRETNIYDQIYDLDKKKKISVLNKEKTLLAREKDNKIQSAFKNWVYKDEHRCKEIENYYNRYLKVIIF